MGLFQPIWMTEDWGKKRDKAIAAVRKIRDQETLYKIATTAPQDKVRTAAYENITDPDVLYRIAQAREITWYEERVAFFNRITDQKLLLKIALECRHHDNADEAARKVKDPELAYTLAMSGTVGAKHGARLVSDPEKVKDIAFNAPKEEARKAAVSNLKDLDALIGILEKETDPDLRKEAYWQVGKCLEGAEEPMTEEQRNRLLEIYLREPDDNNEKLYIDPDVFSPYPEDILRLSREAAREELRARAFQRLVAGAPAGELPGLLRTAKQNRMKTGRHLIALIWDRISDMIVSRVRETGDPAMITAFVRDRDFSGRACSFVLMLFDQKLDGKEGIEAARDEAVNAYLSELPSGEKEAGARLVSLAKGLPPAAREKYGFRLSSREREDEDQYGRNTVTITSVEWRGKTYSFP